MAVRARAGTVDGAQAVCVRVANRLLAETHGDRCPSDPARSVPWLLDRLPFAELGTTGRLLRFMLQRLDPGPASRSP